MKNFSRRVKDASVARKGQGWLDILRLITGGAVTAHKYIET